MSNSQIAQWTRTGQLHLYNEDAVGTFRPDRADWLTARGQLLIVADGIGGGPHGRFASRFTIDTVRQIYYTDRSPDPAVALNTGIQRANEWLHYWASQPAYKGMGAALAAAVLRERELIVAHVGDCRVYVYRGQQLWRLTRDHNWGEEMVARGVITPADVARHPYRNVLTRSLGATRSVQIDTAHYAIYPGDRIVLCSDGVVESVGERGLILALQRRSARAALRKLRAAFVWRKPSDDSTAVVMYVKAVVTPHPSGVKAMRVTATA